MNKTDLWDPHYANRSKLLQQFLHCIPCRESWPTLAELNAARSSLLVNETNKAIEFVDQADLQGNYEVRIYETGQVPTRAGNWHDYFNAHAWLNYPKTKATMNALQYRSLSTRTDPQRTPLENALTLFDENGVVVLCSNPQLLEMIRQHQWQRLFEQHRDAVLAQMRILIIGHAICEKALNPYVGLTAKALLLPHSNPMAPLSQLIPEIDAQCARYLMDQQHHLHSKSFSPLPLLGYPGWHFAEQNSDFYRNKAYFRPKPTVS